MLSTAIVSSLIIGFVLGFIAYHATRVGVRECRSLKKWTKKEPLAYSDNWTKGKEWNASIKLYSYSNNNTILAKIP